MLSDAETNPWILLEMNEKYPFNKENANSDTLSEGIMNLIPAIE